jgi:hypothetical protein
MNFKIHFFKYYSRNFDKVFSQFLNSCQKTTKGIIESIEIPPQYFLLFLANKSAITLHHTLNHNKLTSCGAFIRSATRMYLSAKPTK